MQEIIATLLKDRTDFDTRAGPLEARSQQKPQWWYPTYICASCRLDWHHFGVFSEEDMTKLSLSFIPFLLAHEVGNKNVESQKKTRCVTD